MSRVTPSLAVVAFVFSGLGCTTPTIPIPPPEPENQIFALDADTMTATFSAGVQPDFPSVRVHVFNATRASTGIIVTTNADGSVDPSPPFGGVMGDRIEIGYEVEPAELAQICVLLRDGQLNDNDICP